MRTGMLVLGLVLCLGSSEAAGPPPIPLWQQVLVGPDLKKATELSARFLQEWQAGRWQEALQSARELSALRQSRLGSSHHQTVDARWYVEAFQRIMRAEKKQREEYRGLPVLLERAMTLRQQGKYAQAQPLFAKALALTREVLGEDHPHTATVYIFAAVNLELQQKHAQAQILNEKALAIRSRLLGEYHPYTAGSYHTLAGNLEAQGKPAEAQPLYEKALAIRQAVLGEESRDTVVSYTNLATCLHVQGKYAQAQPLFTRALTNARKVLGEESADTATICHNTNSNLRQLGRYHEAQLLCEKALKIRRRLLGENHLQTANSYGDLGLALYKRGKFKEAQGFCEKALAIHRRLREENIDTAHMYQNIAANLDAMARFAEAQPLHEKALAITRKLCGENHWETAECYSGLAANHDYQGKPERAQSLHEKALTICRKVLGEKNPQTARCYNNLGNCLCARGQYAKAYLQHEKALSIRRAVLGENHPETASSWNTMASNLYKQGRYNQAHGMYEKALAINRKTGGENTREIAMNYNNLAENLGAQGKHALAEPLFERALAIYRNVLGEDHPDTATCYNNLASCLGERGRYIAASRLFEKSLAITRKAVGEESPHTASRENNLGMSLSLQGNHIQAQPHLEKALAIYQKVLGENHPDTGAVYATVAGNLAARHMYAQAEVLFEKALAIHRKVLGEDHPNTARCYTNVAFNLSEQNKYDKALLLYEKGLAIQRKTMGENHPDTARCYTNLAFNLHSLSRFDKAEENAAKAAVIFDRVRLLFAPDALDRAAGMAKSPLPLLAVLQAGKGKAADAWASFEQSLARSTLDEQATRLVWSATEQDRLSALRARMDRLDRLIEQTFIATKEPKEQRANRRKQLLTERLEALDDLSALHRDLEKHHGVLAGKVLDQAAIQKALPADTALLGWLEVGVERWVVLLRSTGKPVWQRVLGTGLEKALTAEESNLPARLRAALASTGDWQPLARQLRKQRLGPIEKHLTNIRHLVVLPSQEMDGVPVEVITEGRTVSLASSGTLFAYLHGREAPRSSGMLALADPVFEVSTGGRETPLPPGGVLIKLVPSESPAGKAGLRQGDVILEYAGQQVKDLASLDKLLPAHARKDKVSIKLWRAGRSGSRFVPGGELGVVLDKRPARLALAENRRVSGLLASARGGEQNWPELPGTRIEVDGLRKLLPSKAFTLLSDSDASEQKLDDLARSKKLGQYRYLHFATHGEADPTVPLQSALILARDALPEPDSQLRQGKPVYDGRLTAEEVLSGWKLDCDLVTLSACQSALGKQERGEGFMGFTQAFLLAGSRSVVVSLWKVDDSATALLMQRFYANLLGKRTGLKQPMSKAVALAEAKVWLRGLSRQQVLQQWSGATTGVVRGKGRPRLPATPGPVAGTTDAESRPFAHPYYWAAFVLAGRPD